MTNDENNPQRIARVRRVYRCRRCKRELKMEPYWDSTTKSVFKSVRFRCPKHGDMPPGEAILDTYTG